MVELGFDNKILKFALIILLIWLFISIGALVFDVLCARWACDSIGNRFVVTVAKF